MDKGFLITEQKVLRYNSDDSFTIFARSTYSSASEVSAVMFKKKYVSSPTKTKSLKTLYPKPPVVRARNRASVCKIKDVQNLLGKLGLSHLPFYTSLRPPAAFTTDDDADVDITNEDLF